MRRVPHNRSIVVLEDVLMGMLKEFKDFAMKGNVVDLAVGVIMGAAFGTVVKSLVDDVLMPPLGYMAGGIDFSKLAIQVAEKGKDGKPVEIFYGKFINNMISFVIVAFAVFVIVKAMNAVNKRKAEAPPALTKTEELLTQIRDSLAKK